MIQFLLKGLLRDRNRSLMPVIIVILGVMLTVVFQSWMTGVIGDSIESNANFTTGHVKVMTAAYAGNMDQLPNDLALLETDTLIANMKKKFPSVEWVSRIRFGGLIDVADSTGETRAQGTITGFGIDLLSKTSKEADRMNIPGAIKKGRLPAKAREILLSDMLSEKLKVDTGDVVSIIGSSMYGEMAIYNFTVCGTVEFGSTALDKGTVIADIGDVRRALNMEGATSEILGFFKKGYYDDEMALALIAEFNKTFNDPSDEYSPVMRSLKEQNNMGSMVEFAFKMLGIMIFVFLAAMSIVLWNAGLLGGLRRYGEFGMRLAIGESKGHVYRTLIYESLFTGFVGSLGGTVAGLTIAWLLQTYGLNFGELLRSSTIMMPAILRARITPETWYIGFIPGVLSTVFGAMLSGIGIYKRQTAQLFKELEI